MNILDDPAGAPEGIVDVASGVLLVGARHCILDLAGNSSGILRTG